MPGFSPECVSGAHAGCSMGTDCRCECHPHTQMLLRKPVPKQGDPRGGQRRKRLRQNITDKVLEMAARDAVGAPTLVSGTALDSVDCGACQAKCGVTDNFCWKCGRRLLGKECERCGLGGESSDVFCRQCGWRYGEKIPQPTPETTSASLPRLTPEQEARLLGGLPARTSTPAALSNSGAPTSFETEIPEQEDPLLRLRREAVARGLLRERNSPTTP